MKAVFCFYRSAELYTEGLIILSPSQNSWKKVFNKNETKVIFVPTRDSRECLVYVGTVQREKVQKFAARDTCCKLLALPSK